HQANSLAHRTTWLRSDSLNMQISLIHSIGKQAAECAEKMGQAEAEFMGRLQQSQTRPGSVGM
ncbi:DUF3158 family protein, partial [Pseudomonas aeruginosa]|uniref:DUF3158 family protein n=1 Tax=Pseudomonas aeruginosa TaxID=287 RepID=UPI00301D9A07